MGKSKKITENCTKHFSKSEIKERKEVEDINNTISNNNIKCPSWVKNKLAKKEFKKISKELEDLNLLTNLDVNALVNYCIAYSNYVEATKQMQGQNLIINYTNKAGATNLIENPLIKIQLKYSDEMKKWASCLGLTIDSRLKLIVPKKEEKEEVDEVGDEFGI